MAARSSTASFVLPKASSSTGIAATSDESRARVLLILGQPQADSFCSAIARTYGETAEDYGLEVNILVLAELKFDLNVSSASLHGQPLEPDLEVARRAIIEASHLVFIYPLSWGMMPALLKGFLDRLLMPQFAFVERRDQQGFSSLLKGKSAQFLTTMDTPPWIVKNLRRSPGHPAFSLAALRFCGIGPVRIRMYGPVSHSTGAQQKKWLRDAQHEAARFRRGRLFSCKAQCARLVTWFRALAYTSAR